MVEKNITWLEALNHARWEKCNKLMANSIVRLHMYLNEDCGTC